MTATNQAELPVTIGSISLLRPAMLPIPRVSTLSLLLFLGSATTPWAQTSGPVATPNFILHPTVKGRKGNELVVGTWTTDWSSAKLTLPLSQGSHGDVFDDVTKPYDMVIGAGTNLYAIGDGSDAASPPALITLAPGSSLTNFGILDTYHETYPAFPFAKIYSQFSPPVIKIGNNTTVTNYGTIGFLTSSNSSDFEAILVNGGSTGVVIHNYGFMGGDAGVRADAGPGVTIFNHAGAVLEAGEGNSALGPSSYNFQDAGMINQKFNGSYCEHLGAGVTVSNWGYCLGSSKGYYVDQGNQVVSDYGGPLVPAAIDWDGHVVFNGVVGSTWESVTGLPTYCSPNGSGTDLDAGAVQFNAGAGPEVLNFYNTIYTIKGSGQTVNYLPSMFGWPIENHITDPVSAARSTVNFYFSGLTASQQATIEAAIAASQGKTPGGFTIAGSSFTWCTLPHINAYFTNPIVGAGINGNPVPGVFFGAASSPQYYTVNNSSPEYATNPYSLINAATVQLNGTMAEQPGQTTIAPGWTLVIGSSYTTYQYATATSPQKIVYNPSDDNFGTSPAPGDSIFLQGALATTTGNIDGQTGQTRALYGALVVNNPTQPISLPNLLGPGSVMQLGRATTTLAGENNTLTGPIYLRDGTLKIAAGAHFSTPPLFSIGARDTLGFSSGIHPVLDISGLSDNTRFIVRGLVTPGPQSQFQVTQFYDGLSYPTIHLGSTTLVVGDGAHTSHSVFLGGLDGNGMLEVAAHETLSLGGSTTYTVPYSGSATKLSSYSGGTLIDPGGTLLLQNENVTGTGPIVNAGTLELNSARHFRNEAGSGNEAPGDLSLQNHVAMFAAAFTQETTGQLNLRVNGADQPGAPGSGAGTVYDEVVAAGPVKLAGKLFLQVQPTYVPPRSGASLALVSAPAGVSGKFDSIVFPANARCKLVSQTVTPTGVSVVIARD